MIETALRRFNVKGNLFIEWFGLTAAGIALFVAGMSVPFLSSFVIFVAPVPLALLTRLLGARRGVLSALFGISLICALMGPEHSFVYLCEFCIIGVASGILLLKCEEGTEYFMYAAAVSVASKLLMMGIFVISSGVNPFFVSGDAARAIITSFSSLFSQNGLSVSEADVASYADALTRTVTLMMPSMLILFSAADTLLCYVAARLYFRRLPEVSIPQLPPFGSWRLPHNIFWALLVTLVLDIAAKAFPQQTVLKMLSLNLMEVLRALFLAEGLSLSWFFLSAFGVNRVLSTVLLVFAVFFSPVSYMLSMIGIFDIWYDLRKRIKIRRK